MAVHAFVDESKRGPYVLCVFVTEAARRAEVTHALRQLRARGAPRLHMKAESDRRRKRILSTLCELDIESTIYISTIRPFQEARARIFEGAIWPRIVEEQIERLVIEPEDGQIARDKRLLYRPSQTVPPAHHFAYSHTPPASDPMLRVPDAVAWACGGGGDWRRRVQPVIAAVVDVDQL